MKTRKWTTWTIGLAMLFTLGLASPAQIAKAQEVAGSVNEVVPDAFQTPSGGSLNTLVRGEDIYREALLRTNRSGWLRAVFKDFSVFTLAGGSQIQINDMIFAPEGGDGSLVADLFTGAARFVTGQMAPESYLINTPVGAIGIRGTDFTVAILSANLIAIWVDEGSIFFQPANGGSVTEVAAGQAAEATAEGATIGTNRNRPSTQRPATNPNVNRRNTGGGEESEGTSQ